jgi:hypothetical protein
MNSWGCKIMLQVLGFCTEEKLLGLLEIPETRACCADRPNPMESHDLVDLAVHFFNLIQLKSGNVRHSLLFAENLLKELDVAIEVLVDFRCGKRWCNSFE